MRSGSGFSLIEDRGDVGDGARRRGNMSAGAWARAGSLQRDQQHDRGDQTGHPLVPPRRAEINLAFNHEIEGAIAPRPLMLFAASRAESGLNLRQRLRNDQVITGRIEMLVAIVLQ